LKTIMLLIPCPYCGARPELEFRYAGEAGLVRSSDAEHLSDQQWADYLYMRANRKGIHAERWRHTFGCGRFFNCIRNTVSDVIVTTYRCGEPAPVSIEAKASS
jgi:sarcosine oxidase subunit delta